MPSDIKLKWRRNEKRTEWNVEQTSAWHGTNPIKTHVRAASDLISLADPHVNYKLTLRATDLEEMEQAGRQWAAY